MSTTMVTSETRLETCERSVLLDAPLDTVFAFCTSRAGFIAHYPNPIRGYRGAEQWVLGSEFWLDYRYFGLPMTWHGKVTALEPNRSFRDDMLSGMFRHWQHTHTVEPVAAGTKYTDCVRFSLGYGRLIDRYVIKPQLDTFFERRHDLLRRALPTFRDGTQPVAATAATTQAG